MTSLLMLERVVRVAERTLGPEHPATQSRRERLERARSELAGRGDAGQGDHSRHRH